MALMQPDKEKFLQLATMKMPFGKYKGLLLIDLPEPYLVWFSRKGFPEGNLGLMLKSVYEIKRNGLEYLFKNGQISKEINKNTPKVTVYTAQYNYSGDDRLDITVKGKDPIGKVFAPTWKMVMGYKEGTLSWHQYKRLYHHHMQQSFQGYRDVWKTVLNREEVTLVCFCKAGSHCHRYLLANYLSILGATVQGERE